MPRKTIEGNWTMLASKGILVIIPERLGDALMCTPAIRYLKQHHPSLKIGALALSELSCATLKNNPDIDRTYLSPNGEILKKLSDYYDLVINVNDRSNALEYVRDLNIPAYHLPPADPQMHQAEQILQFVQGLAPSHPEITERRYRLFSDEKDAAHIEAMLREQKVDFENDALIGCQIGCHGIAKKRFAIFKKMTHPKVWPLEYIIELGQRLQHHDSRLRLVITGSKTERSLGKKLIRQVPGAINLIDKTSVTQLKALMHYLRLFITPDTGLLHVACSSPVPLIALFGPTNLTRTGPYPEVSHLTLLQANSMLEISVDQVFDAVLKELSRSVDSA
jgi:heptosyltransferase-2